MPSLRAERIRRAACVATAIFIALVAASCGGGSGNDDQSLAGKSILDQGVLADNLVSAGDLDAQPPHSPSRTFLSYWKALQFQDYPGAARYVDPGLRSALGEDRLNDAFESQSAFYRTANPVIANESGDRKATSVHWAINDSFNNPTTHTTTLRRKGGGWLIVYDSFLGDSLSLSAEQQAQDRIDPAAQGLSPAAHAAGNRARRLQLNYLSSLGL